MDSPMNHDFPDDDDGDALRLLAESGSDLSQEMEIDFAVDIPNQQAGEAFAAALAGMDFEIDIDFDEEDNCWTCYCSRVMVPTYEAIVEVQATLERIGRPFGATPDGWGSFGNAPE
jgi:hypothetical protein